MENSERINVHQSNFDEKNPGQYMFSQQGILQIDSQQQINSSNLNQSPQLNDTQKSYEINQVYIYPQNYEKPVMANPMQPNYVVINQIKPLQHVFHGYYPVKRKCPFCGANIKTQVEKSFNCASFIMYLFCAVFLVLGTLNGNCTCSGGDCNCDCNCTCCKTCYCCYDAIHHCPNCKKVIGEYDSCKQKFGCNFLF